MKYFAVVLISFLLSGLVISSPMLDETLTPIKHVIVVIQENHSFDNYFGTYPTANGTLVGDIISRIHRVNSLPNNVCVPYGPTCLSPYPAHAVSTENPVEGRDTYEQDYNNGKMDGFATNSGPQSMAYFDYRQIPAYWDYAEEYGLGDNYFSSALTTTTPNRLLLLSGDTPVSSNYGPPPYTTYNQTILGQLSARNITWGYFDYLKPYGDPSKVYPINYISDIDQASLGNVQDISMFFTLLSEGKNLPSVSFVNALGFENLDEHPPSNVTAGELWTVSVVNAVMCSNYWQSSVIFIAYDEAGGYYDHVSPPQVLEINHGFDRPLHGYGERVPLLVISPYARENYVSGTLLNHMSILRFIDYNWNLIPLNGNVAKSNNMLDFFNFTQIPRTPMVLDNQGPYSAQSYPIPLQSSTGNPGEQTVCPSEKSGAITSAWTYMLITLLVVAVVVGTIALTWKRKH
jgi:phospholipase C